MKIKLSLKQIRAGIIILTLMVVSGGLGWKLGFKKGRTVKIKTAATGKSEADMARFWQVWQKLEDKYLIKEDLKPEEMMWGATKGMTSALGDPYTVFLPPERNKEVKEELNGAFEGVGIQLGFKDGRLAVMAPLAGMPAEAVGVRSGDLILHLKDENKGIDVNTVDMSLPEAVEIIRGKKGTKISMTLLHIDESEPVVKEVIRDTIVIRSVELKLGKINGDGKWVDEKESCSGNEEWHCQTVAYLHLSRFGGRTESEWEEAVNNIKQKGSSIKGIILDLRNNPGGYLQGAVRYAGEFLEKDLFVVKQEDSKENVSSYSVTHKGRLLTDPLVVLVNQGSASSSEILAGALQDHERAKLVGKKTFGKGTIQEAIDLGEGSGLHVTTAKWLLPSGRWVNETEGIEPDEEVDFNREFMEIDEQLGKAIEVLL